MPREARGRACLIIGPSPCATCAAPAAGGQVECVVSALASALPLARGGESGGGESDGGGNVVTGALLTWACRRTSSHHSSASSRLRKTGSDDDKGTPATEGPGPDGANADALIT